MWHGRPLYETIVKHARELNMAGATVLRGPMGFGAKSRLHTAKVLRLSNDLPMVIEIVDSKEKIDALAVCLRPSHTRYDGDAVFAVSCGSQVTDPDELGEATFRIVGRAIELAVTRAQSIAGIPVVELRS